MAAKLTYTCDECGAVKKDTNHWFLLYKGEHNLKLTIGTWDDEIVKETEYTHLCGETCVLKRVAALIGLGSVREEKSQL